MHVSDDRLGRWIFLQRLTESVDSGKPADEEDERDQERQVGETEQAGPDRMVSEVDAVLERPRRVDLQSIDSQQGDDDPIVAREVSGVVRDSLEVIPPGGKTRLACRPSKDEGILSSSTLTDVASFMSAGLDSLWWSNCDSVAMVNV